MNRLLVTESEIRIINADNPGQYHVWPASEGFEHAQRVATAWEDQELLDAIAKLAVHDVVEPEPDDEPAKPRRGRKPKVAA